MYIVREPHDSKKLKFSKAGRSKKKKKWGLQRDIMKTEKGIHNVNIRPIEKKKPIKALLQFILAVVKLNVYLKLYNQAIFVV